MKDLQVGDKILTASNTYQPIYSFGHYDPEKMAQFFQIHTQDSVIELTGEHLVFRKNHDHPVRADSLREGDSLLGQGGLVQEVRAIKKIQRQGLYTPFTPDGTVVVDGIVASSYVSLQDGNDFLRMKSGLVLPLSMHDYIHMGMSPLRMFCMGVSSRYCTTLNEEGIPPYAALSIDMSHWTSRQNVVIQTLLLAIFLLVYIPLIAVEFIFGPTMAPLAVFVLSAVYGWRRRHRLATSTKKNKLL